MAGKLNFRGVVTQKSFAFPGGPAIGWVVKVDSYIEGENNSPYPVGEEVAFSERCFKFTPTVGSEVLVDYTDDQCFATIQR